MTGPSGLLAPPAPVHVIGSRFRSLAAVASFGSGLALAKFAPVVHAGWWLLVAAVCGMVFVVCRGNAARVALVMTVITLGGCWGTLRWFEPPADSIARFAGGLLTIECVAETPPASVVRAQDGMDRFRIRPPSRAFVVRAHAQLDESGKLVPASGRLWVSVRGDDATTLRAGGSARITGLFEPVEEPTNPGAFDLRPWAAERGFVGSLALSEASLIQPAATSGGGVRSVWFGWRSAMRERALAVVKAAARTGSTSDADREALLAGLILGEQDRATPGTWRAFTKLGLAHVLTVSGFHLIVMTTMALAALRLLGDIGRLEPLVLSAAILGYLVLVPAESPIVRAAVLSLAVLFADTIGRRYDRLTLLLWVTLGLLVWRPIDLFSLGFQLSVGLTLLLLWSATWFRDRWFAPTIRGVRGPKWNAASALAAHLKTAVAAAAMCWFVSAPWVAHVTGIFSPLAVAATVLLTPLLVVAMWIGFAALLVGMVAPDAAALCGGVLQLLVDPVLASARMADGWAVTAVRVPVLGFGFTVAATALALWWVRSGRIRHVGTAVATVLVIVWGAFAWVNAQRLPSDVALRIDMLDVSDGTCVMVRSGRRAMLWDCGSLRSDAGGLEIVAAARALGVSKIDVAVVTHPDLDHFSRLPGVLEPLGVERVVVGERFVEQAASGAGAAAAALVEAVKKAGVEIETVRAGDVVALGDGAWNLEVIAPESGAEWERDNDHSIVGLLTSSESNVTVLMTGDIEAAAIEWLQANGRVQRATIVEVPHHGSAQPEAIGWVGSLQPRVMMQSSGPARKADPRWDEVRNGGLWLATPELGAFGVTVKRDGTIHAASRRR